MDVFAFVRRGAMVCGEVAVADLERFSDGLPAQGDARLRWSARGEVGQHGRLWLHLALAGEPVVLCQRCLTPFGWPVDARVTLEVVASEAELADGDAVLDGVFDEASIAAPEKVLGCARFDLLAQIEDELILAVPHVTRHEVCPNPVCPDPVCLDPTDDGARAVPAKPSPFAALQGLKIRR